MYYFYFYLLVILQGQQLLIVLGRCVAWDTRFTQIFSWAFLPQTLAGSLLLSSRLKGAVCSWTMWHIYIFFDNIQMPF